MSRKQRSSKASLKRREPGLPVGMALLVVVLAGGLYLNTLGHQFLFDDIPLILQNPFVQQLDIHGIFVKSGYRPVRTLSYALNYAVSGNDPWSYHLLNVLLHSANAFLVLLLVWRWTRRSSLSLMAGLFFAAHPVQTAAVAYVSGRKDLLATFFVLLGLLAYLSFRRTRSWPRAFLAAGFFALALLSKEVAIIFPALLLLGDAFLERRRRDEEIGLIPSAVGAARNYPLLYGLFAFLAGSGLYYALFISRASRMEGFWGGSLEANLGTSFKLFAHYLKLALFPYPLIADYLGEVFPVSQGLTEPATIFSILLFIAYVAFAIWTFSRSPLVSVGMLWFLAGIVPVLQFLPFHELAADHFLYLPMVGGCLVFAAAFGLLESKGLRRIAVPAAAGIIVVFSVVAVDRNRDWSDKQSLWEATYRQAPGSYRANANLGQIYFAGGEVRKGIEFTRRSIELNPEGALPRGNLGIMYYSLAQQRYGGGDLEGALEYHLRAETYLKQAVELDPGDPFVMSNLGTNYKEVAQIYEDWGRLREARAARETALEWLERALRIPDLRRQVQVIWMNYGLVHFDSGNYEAAIRYLGRFLETFPQDPDGNYWMGLSFARSGRCEEAVEHFEMTARSKKPAELLDNLARCYETLDQGEKARETYRLLAQKAPTAENYFRLGRAHVQGGDYAAAAQALQRAMQLDSAGRYRAEIERMMRSLAGVSGGA